MNIKTTKYDYLYFLSLNLIPYVPEKFRWSATLPQGTTAFPPVKKKRNQTDAESERAARQSRRRALRSHCTMLSARRPRSECAFISAATVAHAATALFTPTRALALPRPRAARPSSRAHDKNFALSLGATWLCVYARAAAAIATYAVDWRLWRYGRRLLVVRHVILLRARGRWGWGTWIFWGSVCLHFQE